MPDAVWRYPIYLPEEDPTRTRRIRLLDSIRHYLRMIENTAPGIQFFLSDDPETPYRMWVEGKKDGWSPRDAVFACVEKDIKIIIDNFISPPAPPKSVYQWLRENHYK